MNILCIANIDTNNYEGEFSFDSLTYEKQEDKYLFKISTRSDREFTVHALDAPDGSSYNKIIGETTGDDTFEFEISADQISKINELAINYYDDNGIATISFWAEQIY